jgi:hypothetical protein
VTKVVSSPKFIVFLCNYSFIPSFVRDAWKLDCVSILGQCKSFVLVKKRRLTICG